MKKLLIAIMVYFMKAVATFAVFYIGLNCGLWAATVIDKKELLYTGILTGALFIISYVVSRVLPRLEREGFFDVARYEEEAEEVIIPIEEKEI